MEPLSRLEVTRIVNEGVKVLMSCMVLSVQKVLVGSGRATRRWPMYFPIRRSLPARPEPDNELSRFLFRPEPALSGSFFCRSEEQVLVGFEELKASVSAF